MKKFFTLFLFSLSLLLLATGLKAQNQLYWAEGFDNNTAGISSSAPLVAGATSTAVGYWAPLPSGVWYVYGTYRTTGTSCATVTEPSGSGITIGPGHLRMSKNIDPTAGNPSDSAWFVTPPVSSGIQEFHFIRNQATRPYEIYWTADSGAVTTNGLPTNWQLVTSIGNSTTTCTDTMIVVGQKTATRIKVLSGKSNLNYDVDSIWETSFSAIVPIEFGGINAISANSVVKVSWNILTETNIKQYVIERSTDGANFSEVGELNANGSSKYVWIDNSPVNGNGFYRIKAIDVNGAVKYSTIVNINSGSTSQGIIIKGNPVTNRLLNIELNNLVKGNYTLNIFNTSSQRVFTTTIAHGGGNSAQTFSLPSSISKGFYTVHVTNGSVSFNKNILVE